jgi:hypothetical protein
MCRNLIKDKEEIETFYPDNQEEWQHWLQENHRSKAAIWLIYYKKRQKYHTTEHFCFRLRQITDCTRLQPVKH